jgi:glycine hydroxymethyltransferase
MSKIIEDLIKKEWERQNSHLELIASENYVSPEILKTVGSILTNKYAEGYPGRRYYGGCEVVDEIESLAIEQAKKIFHAEYANVQPHSGSQANMAVYLALLNYGDTILAMDLSSGGHLTHGSPINFSGKSYKVVGYGVDKKTELIDYNEVLKLAKASKPKLIIAGASNYSRIIDFKKFRDIADAVGAYLMVDMAHIAGLVVAGLHPSPVPYADVVTSTTHKTLRGPRGGLILAKAKYGPLLDKALFPGVQGGPLVHVIAGKAVCFIEAEKPEFTLYQKRVLANMKALENKLKTAGVHIVSDGTDNHLLSFDVRKFGITGDVAEKLLDKINITCNKNTIPFDPNKASAPSGIRIGSAALTTRGLEERDFIDIGDILINALKNHRDIDILEECKKRVALITARFPLK